jgi:hypothetical protein
MARPASSREGSGCGVSVAARCWLSVVGGTSCPCRNPSALSTTASWDAVQPAVDGLAGVMQVGRPCRSHAARRTLRGSPWHFVPRSSRAALLPWCAPPVVHAEPEDAHRSPGFLYGSASRASRLHRHAGPAALVSASWPAHLASPGLQQAGSTCRTASRRWACCRTGGGRDVGGIGAPSAPGSHL